MPRRAASGTKGLYKNHKCGRSSADAPTRCDCAWSGKHKGKVVVLATWSGTAVDPRTKEDAKTVLGRFVAAVDAKTFDPTGEHEAPGTKQTLRLFIDEWITQIAVPRKLRSTSLKSSLGVLQRGRLGSMSLEQLGDKGAVEAVETWLNDTGVVRKWSDKTWNNYRELFGRVLRQAVRWDRIVANPVDKIAARKAPQPEHFKQRILVEDVEHELFRVVDQLNRPRPRSTRKKLTQEQADAIRAALAAGEQGKVVAARFSISPAVVSAIKHGDIWRGDDLAPGTKGTEMRRRLIGALDGGLRVTEMQKLQLAHVNWRPVTFEVPAEGKKQKPTVVKGYILTLPPDVSKGGATTGKPEEVFAFTPRFVHLLEARRFQLRGNLPAKQYIFGAEDGRRVTNFRLLWRELFTLAGLTPGRAYGLVWHTARHEFISRAVETSSDPMLAKTLSRIKNMKTLQGYMHERRDRLYAAAAGLSGR